MFHMDKPTDIDEAYIRDKAEHITEDDLLYVQEHEEEICGPFLGKGPLGKFIEELLDYRLGQGVLDDHMGKGIHVEIRLSSFLQNAQVHAFTP